MSEDQTSQTPLLIHVGYHKTGTTWLQRLLFQPAYGYNAILDHAEIFSGIVRPHGLCFDPTLVQALLAERRGRGRPGSADLISSEILCGNPFYGGRESDEYARRLKTIAPDARILLTIREQRRALTSVYMQHLNRCGTVSPKVFFADNPVIGYVAFAPEHLEYHRLVRLYRELFGPEKVKVMTQEDLARDPVSFAAELAAFSGISEPGDLESIGSDRMSPSPPEFCAPLLSALNQFRSGPAGPGPILDLAGSGDALYKAMGALGRTKAMKGLFSKVRPVSREVDRRFAGLYRESNRELSYLADIDLKALGYEV